MATKSTLNGLKNKIVGKRHFRSHKSHTTIMLPSSILSTPNPLLSPNSHSIQPTNPAMMETEQARPLAPVADRPSSDDDEVALHLKRIQRRKLIKCCGCLTAFVLILAVVIITLIFTVFRVKVPVIKLNGLTITKLELVSNATIPKAGTNMSLTADVSVKNPNVASFRYSNTTTTLYYHGVVIGEARGPPGQARARRTIRMNISVDIITDRIMSSPSLQADLGLRLLNMSSFSRVPGRVKILNIIKKHVVVKMNCTFTVNISSQAIDGQNCKRKVSM